ncbi:MAG: TolC family protein [Candidatus Latescibacteria bacterium]|nr:TolC family protein [Candidatus Latescibacterota bacterium]
MHIENIHKIIGIMLIVLMLYANTSFSEEKNIELSLEDCIHKALVENLNFKSSTLGLKLDNLTVKQEQSVFSPIFSMQVTRGKSEQPNYTSYIPVSSIESDNTNLTTQFGQRIWTGASWGVGYYTTLSESNIETEKNYSSNLGLNFTQPLLKGFGKQVNKSGIHLARLTEKTTGLDIEDQATSLVYNVQSVYWNLVYAREILSVLQLTVDQADSLLAYNRTAYDLGIKTESDMLEAQSALINRKQEVIDQEKNIRDLEDELSLLLNLTDNYSRVVRIIPTDVPDIENIKPDTYKLLTDALTYRPDYLAARYAVDKNELQASVAKNSLLPSLDLSTSYRFNGSGSTVSDNFSEMKSGNAYGWEVGLKLSYPIGNSNAEAAYEKSKINMKRAQLSLEDITQQIMAEIGEAARNLEVNRKKIESMSLSVDINERKLDQETERYRNNMSTSYMVLEYQKDLANARTQYQKSLMDYNLALAKLKQTAGILLRDMNITIMGLHPNNS